MNLFNTNDLGGLPLRLNDFRFMQDAWREGFSGFLSQFNLDPNTIYLIGAQNYDVTGTVVSSDDYYIAYQNEIYKGDTFSFDLATLGAGEELYVKLTEVNDAAGSKVFANGITRETYKVRKAEIEATNVAPADSDILTDAFDRKAIYGLRNNVFMVGQVSSYSGDLTDFDGTGLGSKAQSGWALCNGNNGTVDLRGRFIGGYDPTQDNDDGFETVGLVGGNNRHTLTTDEMPAHDHNVADAGHSHGSDILRGAGGGATAGATGSVATFIGSSGSASASITEDSIGGGQPHNNKPEYVTLAFIQYVGF